MDVGRVVLRDDIAAGHAVAAEVTGGAPRRPRPEGRFANVNHFDAEDSRRPLDEHVAALKGTGGRNMPSGRSSRWSRLPQTPTSRSMVVVRRDILVVDRPVTPRRRWNFLEVALAEPQGDGIPEQRLPADPATALGIESRLARPHGRDLPVGEFEGHRVRIEVGRVFTFGPPSTIATRTPCRARCAASVPPAAPEPTITTSNVSGCEAGSRDPFGTASRPPQERVRTSAQ